MDNIKVGIAIITYNRPEHLFALLESIASKTLSDYELAIFDDGSTNFEPELFSTKYKFIQSRKNMGVTNNKNRALFYFTEINHKDIIILIEDDCIIKENDWLQLWTEMTQEFGHMNYEPSWFKDDFHLKFQIMPSLSSNLPAIYKVVTGQVSAIRSDLVKNTFGYLNPRFVGYGYGHVEWTNRLVEGGFGGKIIEGSRIYYALGYGVGTQSSVTNKDPKVLALNHKTFIEMEQKGAPVLEPWLNEEEKAEFIYMKRNFEDTM